MTDDIAALREALQFYADPPTEDENGEELRIPDFYSELNFGDFARKALAALERVAEERDKYKSMVMSHDLLKQSADLVTERAALREKLRKAQEALKFYAERMTYVSRSGMECGITRDNFGDNARAMIAEIEKVLK